MLEHRSKTQTTQTYIKHKSISKGINENENKDLIKLYQKIRDSNIIELNDIEEYVVILNTILVTSVISNLLESSAAIVDQLYDNEQ